MTLPGLVLLVILTSSEAANHPDSECDDCNENGPWWPLFKPSQIIHSEFPEHAQYKSHEQDGRHSPPQTSQEQCEDHGEHRVVNLSNDLSAGIDSPVKSYSSQGKHRVEWDHYGDVSHVTTTAYNSLEDRSGPAHYSEEVPSRQTGVHLSLESTFHENGAVLNSRESTPHQAGVHHSIESLSNENREVHHSEKYSSQHTGANPHSQKPVSYEAGVAHHSQESPSSDNGGVPRSDETPSYHTESVHHSGETKTYQVVSQEARVSGEDRSGRVQGGPKYDHVPEQDTGSSLKSEEGSFFDDGSFFREEIPKQRDNFPEDFEVSKESSPAGESHKSMNSIEKASSREIFGRFKRPVATSYSSMTSVFESKPVPSWPKDLLHPDLRYNDLTTYIKGQVLDPGSHTKLSNGRNVTNQYLVHESQPEDPGVLRINHVVPARTPSLRSSILGKRPSAFVPLDHPVYRYVKIHGGLPHHYRRPPNARSSTLRWQDLHPELRNKFPFKYLQPQVRVQKQETIVHHVLPTKDPFSDSFWKESQKIEDLKPPPLGQTLYFFKKKPNSVDIKTKVRRRHSPRYVYIVKRNKRLNK